LLQVRAGAIGGLPARWLCRHGAILVSFAQGFRSGRPSPDPVGSRPGMTYRISSDFKEDPSMKLILTLLGVVLLVVAAVYFLLPADQLPGFFPGHENGVTRMHYKHGIVAGIAGVVLLALGGWMGRR
jgi:hypothetical protein